MQDFFCCCLCTVCLIAQCHINSSTNIRADVLPWCTGLTAGPVWSHYLPVGPLLLSHSEHLKRHPFHATTSVAMET